MSRYTYRRDTATSPQKRNAPMAATKNAGAVIETPAGTARELEVLMHHQSTAPVQIYTLSDPETGAVRYVGQSADAQARLRAHLGDANRARVTNPALATWLFALRTAGKKPTLRVVQTVRSDLGGAAESAYMALYLRQGAALLNIRGLSYTRIVLNLNGLQTGYARMTIIPTPALVSVADERGCSVADVLCQLIADTVQNAGLGQASRPNDDYLPLRSEA